MKYLSTLILFFLSAFTSFGQNKEKINEMNYFINTIINFFKADRYLLPDSNNIFLSSNAPSYFRDYILTTDTLKDINNKKTSDYFILTNEEKNQILVDTMKWTKLSQKTFQLDKIKLVSKDTVKNRYDPSYLIYKPIFLRDNTVCLFYYDFICSLCGHGTFWLYKKTKKVGNLGLKLVAGQIKTTANKRFYVSRADGSSLLTLVFQFDFCTWLDRTLLNTRICL